MSGKDSAEGAASLRPPGVSVDGPIVRLTGPSLGPNDAKQAIGAREDKKKKISDAPTSNNNDDPTVKQRTTRALRFPTSRATHSTARRTDRCLKTTLVPICELLILQN